MSTYNSVTLKTGTIEIYEDGASPNAAVLTLDDQTISGSENVNLILPNTGGTIATIDRAETFTNKTMTSPTLTTPQINDTSSDHQYVFAVNELTADRTVTLPLLTGNDEFVFKDHAQTLTNKRLTAPKLNEDVAITATATELNKLDGATISTTELNYVVGVTSAIQDQIDGKQASADDLTELSSCQTGGAAALALLTSTEIGILDGATVTTTELNLIAGATARGTTAVASGDGFLHNDGGTMRMTNISKLADRLAGSGLSALDGVLSTSGGGGGSSDIDGLDDALLNTTDYNLVLGHNGTSLTTNSALRNTIVGVSAGDAVNTGDDNTFIGNDSGTACETSSENTCVGSLSGATFSTGSLYLTAVGYKAGNAVTSGANNTFVGHQCGDAVTEGSGNVCIGKDAGSALTTSSSNVFIGKDSGKLMTTNSTNNVFIGFESGNTTGTGQISYSTCVGSSSGSSINANNSLTAFGYNSGMAVTTGGKNTFVGESCGDAVTTGSANTFMGINAGGAVSTGGSNTAVGSEAGSSVSTGTDNTLIGQNSGKQISVSGELEGDTHTSATQFTLESGKSTVDDFYVNYTITFANDTTTVALRNDSATVTGYTGSSRVIVVGSGLDATPANSDTYTLTKGASLTTGSQNTLLGSESTCVATANNQTGLGYQATCTSNNQITIGNPSVTALRCAETTIASVSDARDKTNVVNSVYGLDFVDSLRPVQFTWKRRNIIPGDAESVLNGKTRVGFIAQELQSAMPNNENEILDLVYDVNPERIEAKYGNLIPILTQAIKDLKAQNDALSARVAALESA